MKRDNRQNLWGYVAIAVVGLALLVLALTPPLGVAQSVGKIQLPSLMLRGVPVDAKVTLPVKCAEPVSYRVAGASQEATCDGDEVLLTNITLTSSTNFKATVNVDSKSYDVEGSSRVIPGWLSLLPPLLAILFALLFRQVVLALTSGVWLGALIVNGFNPLTATLRLVDHYAVKSIADEDHAFILVFSLLLGGMIGVITRSGGGAGLAVKVTQLATTRTKGQLTTWIMGIMIFFDDYANSLLVGSSMRPITDRLKISREKLAFLVDATAAPVASIALVSSWIGVEVGYIAEQYEALGIKDNAYYAFIETLGYRFYPWLMLFFGALIIFTRKDFGAMLKAERRALHEGKVLSDTAKPASDFDEARVDAEPRALNAILPIATVIAVAVVGMYLDGRASALADGKELLLRNIFSSANAYASLSWSALFGSLVAIASSIATRSLSLSDTMEAWLDGLKAMTLACVILVLAWALSTICRQDLHTPEYIVGAVSGILSPAFLPALVFLIAALVSFATGTSWGTMAILFPLVVPLAFKLAPEQHHILLGSISSILTGAVWGDHCSPISDTTVMSSMATSCDHVDHVRTQLPYALLVGFVALIVGEIGTAMGFYPAWVGLILGAVVLTVFVHFVGKRAEDPLTS